MIHSERGANLAVQRVLTLRASGASSHEAQAAAEAAVADHFLQARAGALLPDAGATERAASEAQLQRFVELLGGEVGGGDGGGARAAAAPAPASAPAPAAAEDALAPLLRLRASLAADVARLAASREALSRDKRVLGAAAAVHGELARDAAESHELVKAWAEKEGREARWVGAAASLLIATAAYIALRRVAWLFGVRLP